MVHTMATPWGTAVTAVGLFAGTNIDDIVVLSILNMSCAVDGRPRRGHIWAGQYLGMATLAVISLLASRGLNLINPHWVGLLGVIPLTLGIYRLATAIRPHDSRTPASATGVSGPLGVTLLTVANGADNVAAYTPVLATQSVGEIWLTLMIFAVCTAVWCLLGMALVSHQRVVSAVQRWGHWLIPPVYVTIGLWVLFKSGLLLHT